MVGTTSLQHLEEAAEAGEMDLSNSEQECLEKPYEPVPVSSPD